VLLVLAGITLYSARRVPTIQQIEPDTASPGAAITLIGSGFSQQGRLEIDGRPLPGDAVRRWTDSLIIFSLSADSRSGLLRVQTSDGTSNSVFITNTEDLPEYIGSQTVSLDDIQPRRAGIGTVVRLVGVGFGPSAAGGELVFDGEGESFRISRGSAWIHTWTDEQIEFLVPPDMPPGDYRVNLNNRSGNRQFEVQELGGAPDLGDPRRYTVRQELSAAGITERARGVFPFPRETREQTAPQLLRETALPEEVAGPGYVAYRFSPLQDTEGDDQILLDRITRVDLIERRSIRWDISDTIDSRLLLDPVFRRHMDPYLQYTGGDGELRELLDTLRRRNIDLSDDAGTIARSVHRTVISSLSGDGGNGSVDMAEALNGETAAPQLYADLAVALGRRAGLPVRRIYGVLLDDAGGAIPHRWVEYFLPTVGWIPSDPFLGDGGYAGETHGLDGFYGEDRRDGTFGALDDRRITLYREGPEVLRVYPGGGIVAPDNSYAPGALHIEFPEPEVPSDARGSWEVPVVSSQFN
jgi:hypothetical protein